MFTSTGATDLAASLVTVALTVLFAVNGLREIAEIRDTGTCLVQKSDTIAIGISRFF